MTELNFIASFVVMSNPLLPPIDGFGRNPLTVLDFDQFQSFHRHIGDKRTQQILIHVLCHKT